MNLSAAKSRAGTICVPSWRTIGSSLPLFPVTRCPNLAHSSVDEGLQFVRIGAGVACFDVLHGAMEDMRADGFLLHVSLDST